MRLLFITAGSGHMACDMCLRDGDLARALIALGHEVLFVPLYTPLPAANEAIAVKHLFFGGINMFLQQKFALFRHTPALVDRLLDNRWLLNYVARFGHLTQASDLADLTISVLEGEDGLQRKELDHLLDWLVTLPRMDAVILPNSMLAGLGVALRRRLGVPVFCLLSGEDLFIDDFPEPYRARALTVLRRQTVGLDGYLCSNCYYASFMADYLRVPASRIQLMTLGLNAQTYQRPGHPAPEVFTIGFRSQLCHSQGLHLLAEAFIALKRRPETSRCRLRVAGYLGPADRPYLAEIENKIQAAGYAADFEYTGDLTGPARADFLAGLSAFAVPALYPEPIGFYAAEALAAGVPVVLPRAGCLPEWVESTGGGLLVEPGRVDALTMALAHLIEHPTERDRLGRLGREAVQTRHTVDAMARSTLAALTAATVNVSVPV